MRYRPRAQFALPGIIALIVLIGVKDLLPEWLRLYAVISVAITLMMGVLTGQVAQLSSDRARRDAESPDARDSRNREGVSSIVLAFLGLAVALVVTVLLWFLADREQTSASLFGTALVAGFIGSPFELGALLIGLRTRHSKWGRTGLGVALLAAAALVAAWIVLLLSLLLPG